MAVESQSTRLFFMSSALTHFITWAVVVDSDSTVVGAAARNFSFDLYRLPIPVIYVNKTAITITIPAKMSACMFYHVIHR